MRRDLLALALALGGCSFATSSTELRTKFGYDHRARIALLTHGAPDLVDIWRTALGNAGAVEIVSEAALVNDKPEAKPEQLAEAMCGAARAGAPVDEVVAVIVTESSQPTSECVKYKYDSALDRLTLDEEDRDNHRHCVKYKYISTTAQVSATIHTLDATTCRPTRRLGVASLPRTSKSTEAEDAVRARALAADMQVVDAARTVPSLFPRGLSIIGVNDRLIEVSHENDPALVAGAVYVVNGQDPGKRGALGRVRVARADGQRATLETETDFLGVGAGDELRAQTIGHRWTLYGGLTGGVVREDSGSYAASGLAAALRWSPDRFPVVAEVDLVADVAPDLEVSRLSTGVVWGVRWPLGPIAPLALVELGLVTANQTSISGVPARSAGTYRGAGLGAELWLDRYFVLVDGRFRRLSTGAWKTNDEAMILTDVPHPDQKVTSIVVRVAAGWRF